MRTTAARRPLSRTLLAAAVVAGTLALLAGCDHAPDTPRRQRSVRLLPDTPPPPPPPPRPEDKPPPKPQDKPQDLPKPVEAPPQAQALKSDEAAGNGPGSGLAAGAVTQDYSDQRLGAGTTLGGGDGGASRLAATTYAQATTRTLNEYLARDKAIKRRDYKVRVELWLSASGGLQRAELTDSTGDPDTDQALRAALARFPGSASPPPPRLPQPLRLLVSNRLMG